MEQRENQPAEESQEPKETSEGKAQEMTSTEKGIVLGLLLCIGLGLFFIYRQIRSLQENFAGGVPSPPSLPAPASAPTPSVSPSSSGQAPPSPTSSSLRQQVLQSLSKGAKWLADQFIEISPHQGGWPHFQWEEKRPGAPTSALALFSFVSLPKKVQSRYTPLIQKGISFLLSRMDEKGAVSEKAAYIQYRNYTTAMTLSILSLWNPQKFGKTIQRIQNYFFQSQIQRIPKWNWHYGTWNYYEKNELGLRVDISVTAFVLEGLYQSQVPSDHPVFRRVLYFLQRTQNYHPKDKTHQWDGGFAFHPRNSKAGEIQLPSGKVIYLSYGSATCDGLRSLIYAGLPLDHPRVKAARTWIDLHFRVDRNPGFPELDPAGIARGIRFYYYHSLSKALILSQLYREKPYYLERLAKHILQLQRKDGSWQNDTNTMSEDYPIIATSFALLALSTLYPHLKD